MKNTIVIEHGDVTVRIRFHTTEQVDAIIANLQEIRETIDHAAGPGQQSLPLEEPPTPPHKNEEERE